MSINLENTALSEDRPIITSLISPYESPRLMAGLVLLQRAYCYAKNVDADRWEFGVEIEQLNRLGLTKTDLRWLVAKGVVDHQRETSSCGDALRSFSPADGLTFSEATVFALSDLGVAIVAEVAQNSPCDWQALPTNDLLSFRHSLKHGRHGTPTGELQPSWNPRSRELRVGEVLVKQFRVPAKSQEIVLQAFQEEGWPQYIDDPLPWVADRVPKQRLQNAIKRLNSNQSNQLLKFRGDGNGEGIGWMFTELASSWLGRRANSMSKLNRDRPQSVRRANGLCSKELGSN